jgi:hypothetical protein
LNDRNSLKLSEAKHSYQAVMDFAEQERKPKQTIAPTHQSPSAEGSKETPLPPGNGVDYSKAYKFKQNKLLFGDVPPHLQQKAQGQSNADVPEQAPQPASQGTQPTPMQVESATITSPSSTPSSPATHSTLAQASAQPVHSWLNSGVSATGGIETIPFDGRIVRTTQDGKQVIIPVKFGQQFQTQPGDQMQYSMTIDYGTENKTNAQSQASPINVFQQSLKHNAQTVLTQNRVRLDQSEQRYSNPDPNNSNWARLRKDGRTVATLNAQSHDATTAILNVYRQATGDQVSSPFPLLRTATSPDERA